MRSEVLENLGGINEPAGGNIGVGFAQRFVKRRPVGFIEPIARIKWQKFQFSTLGQIRRFVNDQSPGVNTCLDGHGEKRTTRRAAQQALAADEGASNN
jgi:hypothetical protein